jgi:hypothetical protein
MDFKILNGQKVWWGAQIFCEGARALPAPAGYGPVPLSFSGVRDLKSS